MGTITSSLCCQVAQNEANTDFIYTFYYLEKWLFCQKLLTTREKFKKALSANLKPKKANPKVKISHCMYTKFVFKWLSWGQKIYLNIRGVIWKSWRETSFTFQRNFESKMKANIRNAWKTWNCSSMQGVWTTMYFNQPSSKLFSKFFLNLFIFFITNNDLSGIDSTHVQYTRLESVCLH